MRVYQEQNRNYKIIYAIREDGGVIEEYKCRRYLRLSKENNFTFIDISKNKRKIYCLLS